MRTGTLPAGKSRKPYRESFRAASVLLPEEFPKGRARLRADRWRKRAKRKCPGFFTLPGLSIVNLIL
jgi:hypothetical protein